MRLMKFLVAMRNSSSVDIATKRKEETRANSVELDEAKARRADQFRGTKAERGEEIKVQMEKGRAAAWAWYEHGKGGSKKRLFRSSSVHGDGTPSALSSTVRANERGNQSSRFRTEALETSGRSISPPAPALAYLRREASGHRRTKSTDRWVCSSVSVNQTSSLFDSHELDSMSKIIDIAVQRNGSTFSNPTSSELTGHQGPGISALYVKPQVVTIPDGSQVSTGRSEVKTDSSSFRMSFPRYSCRSVSDVVTSEEMSLGGNIVRNDGQKTRAPGTRSRSGWNPGKMARVYSLPRP